KDKAPTPQVFTIQKGRDNKPKPQANKKVKGKGKADKNKQVVPYQPKPKPNPLKRKKNPNKDQACHHCHVAGIEMRDINGIEMLIGANFLRSMKGGIRIEGDEITIYKKVTKIKTSNQTEIAEIAELEVNEEEFLEINESIYFNQEGSRRAFQEQFKPVIDRLKQQGYIREEPLKQWKKNGELCKLDIIC
ncbi:hypothetical protein Tco_0263359, partial [Tanacetum coccineum]